MQITVDENAGFCPGVSRAVDMAFRAVESESAGSVWCLGKLIHNDDCMDRLREKGLRIAQSPEEIPDGACVLIRAHGAPPEVCRALESKHCKILDATCGFVANIHKIATNMTENGRIIIIIGDPGHPEVTGTLGFCGRAEVLSSEEDLQAIFGKYPPETPLCVVSQTTAQRKKSENFASILKKHYTNCKVFDTICNATSRRQNSAAELAARSDAMIVIGGQDSANTRSLAAVCREHCDTVLLVENGRDPALSSLSGKEKIGITAGASTPAWIIKEVHSKL